MGITYVTGTVNNSANNQSGAGHAEQVRFLVDSGAMYSLLPSKSWKKLGLKASHSFKFELADGQIVERPMGECRIKILDHEGHTPVVLGQEGDEALLGAVTLEQFGFVLDPFQRKLLPVRVRR